MLNTPYQLMLPLFMYAVLLQLTHCDPLLPRSPRTAKFGHSGAPLVWRCVILLGLSTNTKSKMS